MSDFIDKTTGGTFRDLIRHPEKKIDQAEDELAFLLRSILLEYRVTVEDWDAMSTAYFNAVYNGNRKKAAQESINLSRMLTRNRVPWSRLSQAIGVLGFDSYDLKLEMHSSKRRLPITHVVRVNNPYRSKQDGGVMGFFGLIDHTIPAANDA